MKQLADGFALSHGHDADNFAHIRNKLRELGRLCITYREITEQPNAALTDLINPSRFNDVVKATRKTAGFDEETNLYPTPSLALKLGHSLKAAAEVLLSQALSDGPVVDDASENKCQRFLKLYNMQWSRAVSSNALRTLTDHKRNHPQYIPVTSDIAKLAKCLKHDMKTGVQALSQGDPKPEVWRSLSEATLTSILLFNRKRSGEVSKLKVKDFENRQNGQSSVIDGLSEWEKALCKSMTRMEIVGKRRRTVPVILTRDMVESMELLMKNRMEVGVPEDNKFFFALLHSQNHKRGSDTLREYANRCGATKSQLLRSTRLRKHIGTVSQIINLRDNELDILANFLGHDVRVHRQFYRLPEETVQLAKVSKILLNMDKGTTSHLAGRTLDQLSVEHEDVPLDDPLEAGSDCEPEPAVLKKDSLSSVNETDVLQDDSVNVGAEAAAMEIDPSFSSTSADETDVCKMNKKKTKKSRMQKKKRICIKKAWSREEKQAVVSKFREHFLKLTLPKKQEIEAVLESCYALRERPWTKIKDFIRNCQKKQDPLDFL
ncbi:uncharacterized protein LOC100891548 [Strongylocentrotus purpuratus]|uniref:Uncharacterized protein n=1 Tax=Strongylocentrotus purpuratus TaxID=7668 RepID=A0A7M7NRJ4_STRPU|nr:uncharacterized protein LOC100891548 [Strongylocentrotus purpuratus]